MYISPIDAIERGVELDNYRTKKEHPNLFKLQESATRLNGIKNDLLLNGWERCFKRYGSHSYDPLSHPVMKTIMKVFNISEEEYRKKPNNVSLFTKDMVTGLELINEEVDEFISKLTNGKQAESTEFLRDFFVELSEETGNAEARQFSRYHRLAA